jgi:PAS domain-containing protein
MLFSGSGAVGWQFFARLLVREKNNFASDCCAGGALLVDGVRDDAIFLLDLQGQILSWNAGAEKVKGYSAEASPCGTYLGYLRRAEGSRGVDLLGAR